MADFRDAAQKYLFYAINLRSAYFFECESNERLIEATLQMSNRLTLEMGE